jgi:hypothetical protein
MLSEAFADNMVLIKETNTDLIFTLRQRHDWQEFMIGIYLHNTREAPGKNRFISSLACRKRQLNGTRKNPGEHPLASRKSRFKNGAVLRMRPEKTEALCHSRCGAIKIPPWAFFMCKSLWSKSSFFSIYVHKNNIPVRIRVRIDSPHATFPCES